MGAHAGMPATGNECDAKALLEPGRPLIEVAGGQYEVIRYGQGQVFGFRCTWPRPRPAGV